MPAKAIIAASVDPVINAKEPRPNRAIMLIKDSMPFMPASMLVAFATHNTPMGIRKIG